MIDNFAKFIIKISFAKNLCVGLILLLSLIFLSKFFTPDYTHACGVACYTFASSPSLVSMPDEHYQEIQLAAEQIGINPPAGNPALESSLIDNPRQYLPADANYARVTFATPVYASVEAIQAGRISFHHGGEDTWVNVDQSQVVDGQNYYLATWGWDQSGWIAEEALSFTPILSRLRGVNLDQYRGMRLAMVYTTTLNVRSTPGVQTEETLTARLGKYDLVNVLEERFAGGAVWYRIADERWIHSGFVRNFTPGHRPGAVAAHEKWIQVNLTEQTLIAHEGDTPVFATLTSTGRPGRATITGLFRPWSRYEAAPMRGRRYGLHYNFADVPWITYFHGAYAYHGVYWHDNYGTVQSAGCVNLSPHDAHWIFHWADPNTWVYIHY